MKIPLQDHVWNINNNYPSFAPPFRLGTTEIELFQHMEIVDMAITKIQRSGIESRSVSIFAAAEFGTFQEKKGNWGAQSEGAQRKKDAIYIYISYISNSNYPLIP